MRKMSYSLSAKFANLKPSAVREILKVTNEPGMIAFAGGSPDTAAFPCEEVKKISAEILGEDPVSALVYGVSEGYEPLRETVRKWLKRRGNIGTDEDVVIITAGGTQVMDITTRVLTSEGDTVICEEPSFIGSLNCFRSHGCKLAGVPIDADGMNMQALEKGSANLAAHIDNLKKFGVPVVVAINHFYADTDREIEFVKSFCESRGADFAVTKCFAEGGEGSKELAQKVADACEKENNFHYLYDTDMPLYQKIETIAREIYGADGVDYTKEAKKSLDEFIDLGADNMPVCMAKTQYSLSDDPKALGRPEHFRITVSSASLSNGAGFVVCQTGSIMTMPGLSKNPAAYSIDIDENGNTVGLF